MFLKNGMGFECTRSPPIRIKKMDKLYEQIYKAVEAALAQLEKDGVDLSKLTLFSPYSKDD